MADKSSIRDAIVLDANGIFCAHVTGSFVVLAAELARGAPSDEWLEVTTFPLFVAAVALAKRITRGDGPLSARTLVWTSVVTGFVAELVKFARVGGDASKLRLGGTLIVAFALGCTSGALLTQRFGLVSAAVPALLLVGPVRLSLPRAT